MLHGINRIYRKEQYASTILRVVNRRDIFSRYEYFSVCIYANHGEESLSMTHCGVTNSEQHTGEQLKKKIRRRKKTSTIVIKIYQSCRSQFAKELQYDHACNIPDMILPSVAKWSFTGSSINSYGWFLRFPMFTHPHSTHTKKKTF